MIPQRTQNAIPFGSAEKATTRLSAGGVFAIAAGEKFVCGKDRTAMAYRIEYSPDVIEHLRILTKRDQRIILDEIEQQLTCQPDVRTRNRKPMRSNPLAPWELRVGAFRVYYDMAGTPEPVVYIRAIGIKERNIVRIGGSVIDL